jgi:hypothetical protein
MEPLLSSSTTNIGKDPTCLILYTNKQWTTSNTITLHLITEHCHNPVEDQVLCSWCSYVSFFTFIVIGHVNVQNIEIWSEENPHAIQQVPSHSGKLVVRCDVYAWQIIHFKNTYCVGSVRKSSPQSLPMSEASSCVNHPLT